MEVVAPASSNFSPMPVEVGTTSALPRPKNHLHHGEPIITAALDGSADDESASLRSPSPPREKEKKKKKSLRQTHDGLAHRKASKKTKKKKANESDDDHIPSRSPSAPLRAKSRKSSRSPKKSPKGSTSEEDEDHAAVAAAVKRSKLKPKRSHSVGAKEVLANRAKHSKAQRLSPTYHHYAAEDNDNDDNTSDVNDEIDDVVGRTVVAHKKSHDKRSHKHKRPSPVTRRSRPVTPSDSDEETSEDEGSSSDEAVTTPQRRKSKRASPLGGSSSGSSRSPEDLGLVSPKGEEIGRMHKEIETLKNLTKLLEEKLEILEHAPDDAAAGTATSSGNSSNASSSKHTSTRQLAHSGSAHSRASDSSDGETSRKKIRPRYATTSPAFHTPKRVEQAEVSRSTADFTKHSRKVFDKKDRSKKVRRARRHDAVASSSDYSDSSDSDNGNGNGEQRQLRKSISLSELRGLAQQGHSGNEAEVSQIKKDRDREHRVNKKRAQRERARGHREAEAERRASPPAPSHPQVHSPTSPSSQASSSSSSSAAKQAAYVSPFGNSPTTKSLEYCCSCLMKTDIPTDGDRKLWKRRVLGLGANGLNLIKPYTEKVERVWAWATIQQWIINDEQNLIKFMIEEEVVTSPKGHGHGHGHNHGHGHGHRHASSSDESDVETSGTDSDEAGAANPPHQHKVVVYTFRVDDANKINDALWKVVKRIQKKRRGLNIAGGGGNGGGGQSKSSRSSAQSSARNSDDEGGGDHVIRGGVDTSADAASGSGSDSSDDDHHHHHHHFKESVQSLFKALTHSLGGHGHGKDHHKEKDNHHKDHHDKITK